VAEYEFVGEMLSPGRMGYYVSGLLPSRSDKHFPLFGVMVLLIKHARARVYIVRDVDTQHRRVLIMALLMESFDLFFLACQLCRRFSVSMCLQTGPLTNSHSDLLPWNGFLMTLISCIWVGVFIHNFLFKYNNFRKYLRHNEGE
jgi:hypothetical protein